MIVAIDGPAGAGKSTVARRVAQTLGFTYLDTGAMYRAVALCALKERVSAQDAPRLAALAATMPLAFGPLTPDGAQAVRLGAEEVTLAIRTPEVASLASTISALPDVRRVVVAQQRRLAASDAHGVVLEGRDIGSVVFPDAPVKIFLTASPEERARRRVEERERRGLPADYAQTLAEQIARDRRDTERPDSPLVQSPDALLLPTDGLSIDAVVGRILARCREAFSPPASA